MGRRLGRRPILIPRVSQSEALDFLNVRHRRFLLKL
jgi:hypothetical protein